MKALTFSSFGGPEVLQYRDVPDPVLAANEVLVQMKASGLNYADIYRRNGDYHLAGTPPYINGYEGAGVVVQTNEASGIAVGQRVAFADVPFAQAALVKVPLSHLIPLPDTISFEAAASILLQGLTAQYLTADSHAIKPGEIIVVHAAAGGVGQLLTQMAKAKGATVIGLTTTVSKQELILQNGADAAFNLRFAWKEKIMAFTSGRGADVVYDSIGSTLQESLDVVRVGGHVVFYGFSGGTPKPIEPRYLMDGSKTLSGGDLWSYLTSREERINRSNLLFDWLQKGIIHLPTPAVFKLSEGKKAYELLESGRHHGKVLLIP